LKTQGQTAAPQPCGKAPRGERDGTLGGVSPLGSFVSGSGTTAFGKDHGFGLSRPHHRIFSGLRTPEAEPGCVLTSSAIPASNAESQEHPSGKAIRAFETR